VKVLNWYKATSAEYPVLIDTTSSKIYNYMRRNVVEKEGEDGAGNTITYYEYEEVKILKEDWDLFMAIMPYRETKTAYYGEKEKVFYDAPIGNVSVFFDNYNGNYGVSRLENNLTVSFDTLTADTNITISIS